MLKKLAQRLEEVSTEKQFPDGTAYAGITMVDTNTLSREFTMPAREIDISALASDIVPERYARNMKSFSTKNQKTLLESRVIVVGTGGLGGTVSETLARIGVGQLTLVDGDRFEESNLNRQLFQHGIPDRSSQGGCSGRQDQKRQCHSSGNPPRLQFGRRQCP